MVAEQRAEEMIRWDALQPTLVDATRSIVTAGKYDDAIFAAFRLVESAIQERISSKSVGQVLLDEAFDGAPARIEITSDARERSSIKRLFEGALGHIRNDRGHKREPTFPCPNAVVCGIHIGFAELLLYYLQRDRNLLPRIDSVRVGGSRDRPLAEVQGVRLDRLERVSTSESSEDLPLAKRSPDSVEIVLPTGFVGELHFNAKLGETLTAYCDTRALEDDVESTYEVVGSDLPLYSDPACTSQRQDFVGLLLRATEAGGEPFLRIIPTRRGRYHQGEYVTHGPFERISVGESWFLDTVTGEPRYAWTGALLMVPEVLGRKGLERFGGIRILPPLVNADRGDRRTLRVRAIYANGPIRGERDVSSVASWSTAEPSVAFVDRGILYAKNFGRTSVEATWQGLAAKGQVQVANQIQGSKAVFFQGIRRLQQIRFDPDDNLFFVNQSTSIWTLYREGGLTEVAKVALDDMYAPGIDCIFVDNARNLYASTPHKQLCLRFQWRNGEYLSPVAIAQSVPGTKKSITGDAAGRVFVATMGGSDGGLIVSIDADGNERSFQTRGSGIQVAVGPDALVYTGNARRGTIDVYTAEGDFVEEIPYEIADSPADLLVLPDGDIVVAFFHTGQLVRISRTPGVRAAVIADGLGNPGGVARDSHGSLYVSDFSGDAIYIIR